MKHVFVDSGASAARIPDTDINGNEIHHPRQTYMHLFIVPLCRPSEYVTGTMRALPALWR